MLVSDVLREHSTAYDYILIDTHPETSDLMRSVICASDFAVSPVKLDQQSSVGVPSAIEAVNSVNADLISLALTFPEAREYVPTQFVGSIGMMTREYAGDLKRTERSQRRALGATVGGGMFESYITEGDGLRKAAENKEPVWFISGANADKQTNQFRELTEEFLRRCP
jgi:chromosome partitioning protein